MSEGTFSRNLMQSAVWQAMSARLADDTRGHRCPPVFLNRIKRLLDLDKGVGVFADMAPNGRGTVAAYSPFSAFLMALALVFLDAGFKQSDVFFILRHIKDELREHYDKIAVSPFDLNQQLATEDRPDFPSHPDSPHVSDQSVFLLISKVELRECWSGSPPDPFFIGPTFCYGLKDLQGKMEHVDWQRPSRFVVEIAGLVHVTRNHVFREQLVRSFERHSGKLAALRSGKGASKIKVAALTGAPPQKKTSNETESGDDGET